MNNLKSILFALSILLNSSVIAQLKLENKKAPEQMKTLNFLIGKWQSKESQWFDSSGKPLKIIRGKDVPEENKILFQIKPIMQGLYLEGDAENDKVRSYFFYHEIEKTYYHIALDFMGAVSIMTGSWNNDKLVFTDIKPQNHPKGGTIMWRRTFFDIQNSGYSFTYEASLDEGKSWQLRGKQSMQKTTTLENDNEIPNWLIENWKIRTANDGTWITDNTKYINDEETFDAYGIQWEYGVGKKYLKGKLFCMKENKEVVTAWHFTEYWDPKLKEARIVQIGRDGTVGQGKLFETKEGKNKEQQTFIKPNGETQKVGHIAWFEDGAQHTQSYDIINGKWKKRRFYIWKQEKPEPENSYPEEYKPLTFLIGEWLADVGTESKAKMIFEWSEDQRLIKFKNAYKKDKLSDYKKENEGIISYHGVKDLLVFMSVYAYKEYHLMAEGQFKIKKDGTVIRTFTCFYEEGDSLPWSNGAKAPKGGRSITFKQIWKPINNNSFEDHFYWKKKGKWEQPLKKEGEKESKTIWRKKV